MLPNSKTLLPQPGAVQRRRLIHGVLALVVIGAVVWVVFAWAFMPAFIRRAYAGEHVPILSGALDDRSSWPVEHYLKRWNRLAVAALVGPLCAGAVFLVMSSSWFARRIVNVATPGTLGALRTFVCVLAMCLALRADLVSVATMSATSRTSMGLMDPLFAAPTGLSQVVRSEAALRVMHVATALMLLIAAVGYRTRWSLALGTLLYFLHVGIIHAYSKLSHAGLVPLYALAVLCFTRCGDGWSIDRLLRQWRGQPVPPADGPQPHYAWGRYAVWTVVAISYVCAGLSKIGNGGWFWWDSVNMRRTLFAEGFHLGGGQDDLALKLAWLPPAFFAGMGLGTLFLELGMGLTLVSKWARRLLPALVAAMHVGIDVLQRIPFYDLVFIQAIFYDWGVLRRRIGRAVTARRGVLEVHYDPRSANQARWARVLPGLDLFGRLRITPETPGTVWRADARGRSLAGVDAARAIARALPAGWLVLPILWFKGLAEAIERHLHRLGGGGGGAEAPRADDGVSATSGWRRLAWPAAVFALIVLFLGAWARRVEAYPLTSWQMFSQYKNSSVVTYCEIYQTDERGRQRPISGSQLRAIGSYGYVGVLVRRAFSSEEGEVTARQRLVNAGRLWNRTAPKGQRVTHFRIARREWDFVKQADDRNYGAERDSITIPVIDDDDDDDDAHAGATKKPRP